MTAICDYTDHDLLIALHTKFDMILPEIASLKERVTTLERQADRQSGFWAGGKAVWTFLASLPAGVAGYILGGRT